MIRIKKIINWLFSLLLIISLLAFQPQTEQKVTTRIKDALRIDTLYGDNKENMVADINLTQAPYQADLKGREDIAPILNKALADLSAKGGGTVFLPAGFYRLCSSITIPNYCEILGEWNNPLQAEGKYGTVILADVPSSLDLLPGLIRFRGSTGVKNLTFYYPGQTIKSIRPYPYTFEVMGGADTILEHAQFTIQNVTLLNSYRGLSASRTINSSVPVGQRDAHENLLIENLYGTVLKMGIDETNESDVGFFKNIHFSPDIWSNCPFNAVPTSIQEIKEFTYNNGCGFRFGDCEWSPYYDLYAQGYLLGVQIVKGSRLQPLDPIEFMGSFYNLVLENCCDGFVADALYYQWGVLLTKSSIQADKIALANNAQYGYIKLSDVKLSGGISGERIYKYSETVPLIETKVAFTPALGPVFYDAVADFKVPNDGVNEAGALLQSAINKVFVAGGGILYLPAGYYKVTSKLNIPDKVEVRGSLDIASRDVLGAMGGTVIFSYYDAEVSDPIKESAFITLGSNACLKGLRIVYPNNNLKLSDSGVYTIRASAFTVKVSGAFSTVEDVDFVDSYRSILVLETNNVLIKNITGMFIDTGIQVQDSQNVYLDSILSNATMDTQSSYNTFFPDIFTAKAWSWRIKDIWNFYNYTLAHTVLVRLNNSSEVHISSMFTFSSKCTVSSESSSFTMLGCGADNHNRNGFVVSLNNSILQMVNELKYNAYTYELKGNSKISIFGRMNLNRNGFSGDDENVLENVVCASSEVKANSLYEDVVFPEDKLYDDSGAPFNPLDFLLGNN